MTITTQNEFETIPAWTYIAGQSNGSRSPREDATDLLTVYDKITSQSYSSISYWIDIAKSDDEDEHLLTVQQEIVDMINEQAPLPEYCSIKLNNGEWTVTPDLEEAGEYCEKLDECPDALIYDDNNHVCLCLLIVNDHGNVTCMQWDDSKREYCEIWSIV